MWRSVNLAHGREIIDYSQDEKDYTQVKALEPSFDTSAEELVVKSGDSVESVICF